MKRISMIIAGFFLLVGGLTAYVTVSVAADLAAVKDTLARDADDITSGDLEGAHARLVSAQNRIRGPAARSLKFMPVIGANIDALRNIVDATEPVMAVAVDLHDQVQEIRRKGVMRGGRIDIPSLKALEGPLERQASTLEALRSAAQHSRGGWLIPPLWHSLYDLEWKAESLLRDLVAASEGLKIVDELLGADEPRRYLVLLMNNAELRGAGGILTGVGTARIGNGRMSLSGFRSVHDLRDHPPRRVPAPDDFRRRFGPYQADTTLWLNTTSSPDVPDVALVASRLYEKATGIKTDGALLIDPIAIERLTPEGWSFTFPQGDRPLQRDDIADFTFSDGYSLFRDQEARRNTILQMGLSAVGAILEDGLDPEALERLGPLVSGGHLRVNSFDPQEQDRLGELGLTGDLTLRDQSSHSILVTAQNRGDGDDQGTKLDHWAEREVRLDCELSADLVCAVKTTITNDAPRELPRYVAGDGTLRSYLEVYLRSSADVLNVSLDGSPAEYRVEEEEGHLAIGTYIEIGRGEEATLEVAFRDAQEKDKPFRLVVRPQPLTRPAEIDARITLPEGWRPGPAGGDSRDTLGFQGDLTERLVFEARQPNPSGLTALWKRFQTFWHSPLLANH